jgi:hypothetical protein
VSGPSRKVVIIPADREAKRVSAGVEFKSAVPGWFVPDATWREIELELGRKLNKDL